MIKYVILLILLFECGSVVVCVEYDKDGCYSRGLHQGQAALMPSLSAISTEVFLLFPRIIAWALFMFYLFVNMDE